VTGTALHSSQLRLDDHGHNNLYLVTESPDGRECWMTAVDLDQETVRWQRQIGLIPQHQPLVVDGKLLTWDRGGDLFLFEPDKVNRLPDAGWRSAGRTALTDQAGQSWLLPGVDGHSAVAITVQGTQLHTWKFENGLTTRLTGTLTLEAAIAGSPALLDSKVILPLANGRLVVAGAGNVVPQEEWRAALADKQAQGNLVALGNNTMLSTDGSTGLSQWRLNGFNLTRVKTANVKARIITPPALLAHEGQVRIYVADVGRCVTLLRGDDLSMMREVTLSDGITAGPFVRAGGVGIVVGSRRLVWLNPDGDTRWAITFPADIVGEPQLIDGTLIVADESGQIQAVDPATGRSVGWGYAIHADVAPAATPVPFGHDRLFVPLTDGTVLLPSRDWFRASVLFPWTP
jgi:outer membrane protein assembly factor BamB